MGYNINSEVVHVSNFCIFQKNPTAIRSPEEDRGDEKHSLNLLVTLEKSSILSPYIFNVCQSAVDSTYVQETDVKLISQGNFLVQR